jgi:hypothetical protein
MLRFDFYRVLVFVATCSLGLAASTAMAKGGHRGGGQGGHYGGGHHGGHHGGYSGHRSYGGRHYGGYRYGGSQFGYGGYGLGYSRGGFNISIGGGYPYRYGGFGYRGIGYGYPYRSYGFAAYSPYPAYRPYYPSSVGIPLGYAAVPSYGYAYDRAPAAGYVYPEQERYRAAKPAAPSSELRPGMILPDGSRVISVGPLDSAAQVDVIEPEATESEADAPEKPEPAIPAPNEPGTEAIEELPAATPDSDSLSTSI